MIQSVRLAVDVLFRFGVDFEKILPDIRWGEMEHSQLPVLTFQIAHDKLIEVLTLMLQDNNLKNHVFLCLDFRFHLVGGEKLVLVADHLPCPDADVNRVINLNRTW